MTSALEEVDGGYESWIGSWRQCFFLFQGGDDGHAACLEEYTPESTHVLAPGRVSSSTNQRFSESMGSSSRVHALSTTEVRFLLGRSHQITQSEVQGVKTGRSLMSNLGEA